MWIDDRLQALVCFEPVGTVGGGTHLKAQEACIRLLTGTLDEVPSPELIARAIIAGVLAAEVSLLASLAEGSLVESHMKLNRKSCD